VRQTGVSTRTDDVKSGCNEDVERRTSDIEHQTSNTRLSKNLALVETLRDIGSAHGRSPGEVAIAWTLRKQAVTAAIVGARNAEQVEGIYSAADFRLSDSEVEQLEGELV
jgi:aryl-alcohol dehydrogenase-like predicted oxidoreductase